MKIKGPKKNIRVEVDIKSWHRDTEEDIIKTGNEIASQIKRHVDEVGGVRVVFDQEDICSDCEGTWTEGDSQYNWCCDKSCPPEET